MNEISLGFGTLTWRAIERRSDRYGSVYLIADGCNSETELCVSLLDTMAARAATGLFAQLVS